MNKKIFSAGALFFFAIGTAFLVAYFLPNEISFKMANAHNNFEKAEKLFPNWEIIPQNNMLGMLYKEKKYQTLKGKIETISKKKCDLKNESISEFCANIFYMNGLVHYQLGKDLESQQQKPFFEKALFAFSKVMMMTPKNSQEYNWSKENIDFIMKKFQETQKKEQKNKSEKKGEKVNKEKSKEQNQQNSTKNSEEKNQKKENSNEDNKKDNKKQKSSSSSASRLPKQMQQELKEAQKQLEENQHNSQKGFNRSRSAAKNNAINPADPFSDPFFQQFFGNDPFFYQNGPQKFSNTLQNPNEKDW